MGVRSQEGSGADMSYNGPEVPLYRPTGRWAVPYEEWRDDAVCDGMDPNLFELGDPDEIPSGRTYFLTEDDQWDLIAQGLRVCSGCPVRAACKANSNELDRYWTTRGGQPPEGLFQDSKMPKPSLAPNGRGGGWRQGERPARAKKKFCKRGHNEWHERANGKRRCLACDRAREKARWARKPATLEA